MKLKLHANGQVVLEDPFGQGARIHDTVHRRDMNSVGTTGQIVARDYVACVLVIQSILDNKLHFVVRPDAIQVAPIVLPGFAATRALHVEDRDDASGDARGAAVTTCLEKHRPATVEQALHERIHILLQQWLTAGDLDERAGKAINLLEHLFERMLAAFVERVRRITPRAAQIAGGQPHEDAGTSGVCRLALDGIEDFVNRQQSFYYPVRHGRGARRHIRLELPLR